MSTAVQTATAAPPATPQSIGELVRHQGFLNELAGVLPKHCNIDRMGRMLFGAIRKTPKLEQCSLSSMANACRQLTAWGLEPDGHHAHLIPYGRECTLVIDYKGLVALCYRSGLVQSIHADVVYQGDLFRHQRGHVAEHVQFDFRVDDEKPDSQGEIIAAYVIVNLNAGAEKHEVMSKSQIDKIRAASKAGRSGPWKDHYEEMAKKTVFRRAAKWLPLSAEIVNAFQVDHDTPAFTQVAAEPQGVQGLAAKLGMTTAAELPKPETVEETPPEPEGNEPYEPTAADLAGMTEPAEPAEPATQTSMLPEGGDRDSYYGGGG